MGLPSAEVARTVVVEPALTWKSRAVYFKVVGAGNPVSYGSLWRPEEQVRVITIPVGYGDGYLRSMTGRAEVGVRGQRYPVVAICMDQVMVNIGWDSAFDDEVLLLGEAGGVRVGAEELAACRHDSLRGAHLHQHPCAPGLRRGSGSPPLRQGGGAPVPMRPAEASTLVEIPRRRGSEVDHADGDAPLAGLPHEAIAGEDKRASHHQKGLGVIDDLTGLPDPRDARRRTRHGLQAALAVRAVGHDEVACFLELGVPIRGRKWCAAPSRDCCGQALLQLSGGDGATVQAADPARLRAVHSRRDSPQPGGVRRRS